MTTSTRNPLAVPWPRRSRAVVWIAVVMLWRPAPASAALGGDISSVQADQARLQAAVMPAAAGTSDFNVQEMRASSGVTVREYLSPAGKVFAVTWQGPSVPDLKQLLGDYFEPYIAAAQAAQQKRTGRGPVHIETASFVFEQSGHQRAFTGRAYVPQLMPARVAPQSIR